MMFSFFLLQLGDFDICFVQLSLQLGDFRMKFFLQTTQFRLNQTLNYRLQVLLLNLK